MKRNKLILDGVARQKNVKTQNHCMSLVHFRVNKILAYVCNSSPKCESSSHWQSDRSLEIPRYPGREPGELLKCTKVIKDYVVSSVMRVELLNFEKKFWWWGQDIFSLQMHTHYLLSDDWYFWSNKFRIISYNFKPYGFSSSLSSDVEKCSITIFYMHFIFKLYLRINLVRINNLV